jgi:hypothetical protein
VKSADPREVGRKRKEVVPKPFVPMAFVQPAVRGPWATDAKRESRENRERSRRCDTAPPFGTDGELDGRHQSHCRAARGGKAARRAVKPEDLPAALKVWKTDEDSVAL